jgi:hypothetical protein
VASIDTQLLQQTLIGALGTALLAVLGWLSVQGRKALRNLGKTRVQIAEEDLKEAVGKLEEAHKTPDATDDLAGQKDLAEAKSDLRKARSLNAVLDILGEDDPKAP